MSFDANALVNQLSQLGRDLDTYVGELGRLEHEKVNFEAEYRRLLEEHEDALAEAFLAAAGQPVETRKCIARLKCVPSRLIRDDAKKDWQHSEARVRTQFASISALHRRIEIGRSMLSREKTLMSISEIGHP
jgi:hypothetical protein